VFAGSCPPPLQCGAAIGITFSFAASLACCGPHESRRVDLSALSFDLNKITMVVMITCRPRSSALQLSGTSVEAPSPVTRRNSMELVGMTKRLQ
jgi:hypothetical protein